MSYFFIEKLCQSINSIYFKKVHVIGKSNIPDDGPFIICGNHANQFIDPIMIISNVKKQLSFTIAASSFSKPIVGSLAKSLKAIPVKRPEDSKIKGSGKLVITGNKVKGVGSKFIEEGEKVGKGWSLFIKAKAISVKTVIDNENLEIVQTEESDNLSSSGELAYFVSKKLLKFLNI